MMNANKNVSAPPLRPHLDKSRSSGGERKVSKNSTFPREGERRKRPSTIKTSAPSTFNVDVTSKSNNTGGLYAELKKREDPKDTRVSYPSKSGKSDVDDVGHNSWGEPPKPVTKSRAKAEGKRAGMKWTIYIDTAGGHVTKKLKIVRGIETFEEDDPPSPVAGDTVFEVRAEKSTPQSEAHWAHQSIKSAPTLAPFPCDDDIPATPVSQVHQLSSAIKSNRDEHALDMYRDVSREVELPDVPNLREENDFSFLPNTLLLRTPVQAVKGPGFHGDLISPLETPSLGTTMDDESIENSAHLSLDKIDGDQWGCDQNISSSESEQSDSSDESETEMFENDDTYVKEYLIAKMEQEQNGAIYDEESIDPLDDFKPRAAGPSATLRQSFDTHETKNNVCHAIQRELIASQKPPESLVMSNMPDVPTRNMSSLPEHEVVPDSAVGPWTAEKCEALRSKQRRKSQKPRKRSASKPTDGSEIKSPPANTTHMVLPPRANSMDTFMKPQFLRAPRTDSTSRFSGNLRRKDSSSPGAKLQLEPDRHRNETKYVLPPKPNPAIQKTEALLKSLGSVSSSESSSSAYSFGRRRHMLQTYPSQSSSSSPGMLLDNPHRFPDNEFDAERSTTFMQLNLSATDGVQLVDNQEVESSHTRKKRDQSVADDDSIEAEDETQAVIPRFSALQTNESTSIDPPRKPIRASDPDDQNAARSTKRGVRGMNLIRTISNLQNRNDDVEKKSRRDDNERRNRFFGFGNTSFGNLPTPAELLEDDSFAS